MVVCWPLVPKMGREGSMWRAEVLRFYYISVDVYDKPTDHGAMG